MSLFEEKPNYNEELQVEDSFHRYLTNDRLYTITIKPTSNTYKTQHQLEHWSERFINRIQGTVKFFNIEKKGSPRVHIHMLVQCPVIHNKAYIASQFKGFHIHCELIRKNKEIEAIHSWERYINKEASDSEFYWSKYGNMFIPDDEGSESNCASDSESSNIIHYQ